MQEDLFGDPAPSPPPRAPALPSPGQRTAPSAATTAAAAAPADAVRPSRARRGSAITAPPASEALRALRAALPPRLRLGTSSWGYPGWQGAVWEGAHSEQQLAKSGLRAYAQHPLLRAVSIDRSFYRPLSASEFERYAVQVPEDFRFVVKAPSLVTDALVRAEDGRGRAPNPAFLNPALARSNALEPALAGLGQRLGALVFQLSPLPLAQLRHLAPLLDRLHQMLRALPPLSGTAPDGVVAIEVRDPEWLTPEFAAVLRDTGATYCLGLHPKLPPLAQQLPVLRALWPGPLVCRWNLHPVHGPYGYEEAEKRYRPYDRLQDPDPEQHAALAALLHAVTLRGQNALVTISNHAEGSAPATVRRLAEAVRACAATAPLVPAEKSSDIEAESL